MTYYIQRQTADHKVKTISWFSSAKYSEVAGIAEALQADDPLSDYRAISKTRLIKEQGYSGVSRAENDLIAF